MSNTSNPGASRPSAARVLGVLAAVVVALTLVFGISVMKHRSTYRAYVRSTLESGTHPPRDRTVAECVDYAVTWAMACPGIESWCFNEAPRVARACFEAGDLEAFCLAQGDAVAQTRFGVHECSAARDRVEGKYAQRSHKKYCASVYRALAEACRSRTPTARVDE